MDLQTAVALVSGAWPERGCGILRTWDEVVDYWQRHPESFRTGPGRRPAVWWWIEQGLEVPDSPDDEAWLLDELGFMGESEQRAVYEQDQQAEGWPRPGYPPQLFRRYWSWWKFESPEPANPDEYESSQLIRLKQLGRLERKLLDDPRKHLAEVPTGGRGVAKWFRYAFNHMTDSERSLLGFLDDDERGCDDGDDDRPNVGAD